MTSQCGVSWLSLGKTLCVPLAVLASLGFVAKRVQGDELLFSYDGEVLPIDAGFLYGNTCDPPCSESVENGRFVLRWMGGGDLVYYGVRAATDPDPHPATLWVEWRFRSDVPRLPNDAVCDGFASVQYRQIVDSVDMYSDAVVSAEGGSAVFGLTLNEFYTVRFESRDGANYRFAVDGRVLFEDFDPPPVTASTNILFGGDGSCGASGINRKNEWDFLRYGTIADGEIITSSDPPAGIVEASKYPDLDRFTVTFDQPAFVYVDQIGVSVTPMPAGTQVLRHAQNDGEEMANGGVPRVLWVKRLDNGPADTVDVVLDRPLPLNATTTFTFDDGVATNVVEYTYLLIEPCCLPDGTCIETTPEDCSGQGGNPPESPLGKGGCEGDADGDGVDGACGDECPMDENKLEPHQCGYGVADVHSDEDGVADCADGCDFDANKTAPGQCGCGVPDTDSDGDTVADCLDQCDGEDDRIDDDGNGTPDCAQFQPIPTTSVWGLGIMALLFLIAAKLGLERKTTPLHPPLVRGEAQRGVLPILVFFGFLCASATADGAVRYAKTDGVTSGNCDSWSAACTLDRARTVAASGDEIWVKAGTYGPFALKNGVKIIGGFAGTETAASQSNPSTNVTIVDGGDQDQCVTGNGEGPTTILRGFTIKNCFIDGTDPIGAGVFLKDSSARIVQCIIEQNEAQFFGAGAGLSGTGAPEFINCTFRNNGTGSGTGTTPYGGGAVFLHSGSVKFTNCLLHDNVAGEGGAFLAARGTATFVNCTFSQNTAGFGNGGAIFDPESAITIQNSIVWGNEAAKQGDQVYNGSAGTSTITYSDIEGGYTGTGNINADPEFVNPSGNDFKITPCSPCQNAGSNALLPADVADLDWDTNTTESIPKDLASANRKIGFVVDMGAYETTTCTE